jgi:hypothetical protein
MGRAAAVAFADRYAAGPIRPAANDAGQHAFTDK